MSLPSTPNNNQHGAADGIGITPPPKTPSASAWARALGMFSAKKPTPPPAANSMAIVNGHAQDSPISAGTANNSDNDDDFQSPMSSAFSPATAANNNSFSIGTSPTTARGSQRKPSRLESTTLSSQKAETAALTNGMSSHSTANQQQFQQLTLRPMSAFRNAKSPRKNRAIIAATTTTIGSRINSATAAVSFQSKTTAVPTRRYRPTANLFSGSKVGLGRKKGGGTPANNGTNFGKALTEVRDLFVVPSGNEIPDTSTNIYSAKGGIMWGSLDGGPSRFTVKVQKRQRPMQSMQTSVDEAEEEEEENDRRTKRRKKVAFDQQEAQNNANNTFTTSSSATTPHKSNNNHGLKRKDTPVPPKTSHQVSFESPAANMEEDNVEERSVPSSQKLPSPAPACDFDFEALRTEEQVAVNLPPAQSYDAAPDPEASKFLFAFRPTAVRKVNNPPAAKGLVSTTSRTNYEEKRYERPASPVRNRTTRNQNDDGTNQQAPKRRKSGNNNQAAEEVVPDWVCTHCETKNNNDETVCQKPGCGKVRPFSGVKLGWGGLASMEKLHEGTWKCPACEGRVKNHLDACPSCDEKKPADVNANVSSTQPNTASNDAATAKPAPEPKFPFRASVPDASATTTTNTGGFTFAAPPAGAPAPTTGTGGFLFKAPQSSSKEEEEKKAEAPTPASAAPTGGFLFGGTQVPAPNSSSAMKVPATPSIGSNGKLNGTTPKAASSFGSNSMGENGDKKPFQFGQTASSDKTSAPAQTSTGSPVSVSFGASSGFASSAANGNGGQFGTTPATEEKPTQRGYDLSGSGNKPNGVKMPSQVPPTLFGAPASAASVATPASGTTFQFGSTSASKDTAEESSGSGNTSSSQFGNATTGGGVQFGTSGGFSTTSSSQAPAPSAASGGFGSSSGAPAPLFGSGTPIPAFGSTTTAASGAPTPAPLFGSGTPIPAFGSSTNAAGGSFGAPSGGPASAPLFGSGTPIPAFGSTTTATPSASSAPAFGSTGATPARAATSFGSTPAPAATDFGTSFGTNTTATPLAPAFGTTSTTPAPAATSFGTTPAPAATDFGTGFGTAPAAAAFGSTPASTGFNGTTFGANPTSTTGTGFGGAPSANFGSSNPQAATPAAFARQASTATSGFGTAGFGTQTPAATSQGFDSSAFGSNAAPSTGGFGGIPGLSGGFGSNGFGTQQGGFQSTPAPPGGFNGGGYGATVPNTAPPGAGPGAGFNIGSSGKSGRRIIRARRPKPT